MQSLIRSKSAGVTGGGAQRGPVLVGTFFMVAEAVFQSAFLKHVKYFILSCIECKLLWSIVDRCLYLTHCDCSPSCFDPVYLLVAYLWLGSS